METQNPITIVESLDPDKIREQLQELYRTEKALRTLLRAAVAREKAKERKEKVNHAK